MRVLLSGVANDFPLARDIVNLERSARRQESQPGTSSDRFDSCRDLSVYSDIFQSGDGPNSVRRQVKPVAVHGFQVSVFPAGSGIQAGK